MDARSGNTDNNNAKLVRQSSSVIQKEKSSMRRVTANELDCAESTSLTNIDVMQLASNGWYANNVGAEKEIQPHTLISDILEGSLLINGKSFLDSFQYRRAMQAEQNEQSEALELQANKFLKRELFNNDQALIDKHFKQLCQHGDSSGCNLFEEIKFEQNTIPTKTKKFFNLYRRENYVLLDVIYYDVTVTTLSPAQEENQTDSEAIEEKYSLSGTATSTFLFNNPYEISEEGIQDTDSPTDVIDLNSNNNELYVGFHFSHIDFSNELLEQLFLRPNQFNPQPHEINDALQQEFMELRKLIESQTLSNRDQETARRIAFSAQYLRATQKELAARLALIPTLTRKLLDNKKDKTALAAYIELKNSLLAHPKQMENLINAMNSLSSECHYRIAFDDFNESLKCAPLDPLVLAPFKMILTHVILEAQKIKTTCAKRNALTKILKKSHSMLIHMLDPSHQPSEKLIRTYAALAVKVGRRRWGRIIGSAMLGIVCTSIIGACIAATALTFGGAFPLAVACTFVMTFLIIVPAATAVSSLSLIPLICSGLLLFQAARRKPSKMLGANMNIVLEKYKALKPV